MPRLVVLLLLALAAPAAAGPESIYFYEDKDGVIHFTNVTPPSGTSTKWKRLPSGPGKASSISGASSYAGCRASRQDARPARDRAPERYVRYDPIIREAADSYAIPEELIRAVIKVESDYDPQVISCAGAKGLMQIMPYEEKSQRLSDVFDPRQNILAGTRLLRINANRFRGDLVRTIASYHAGAGAVDKYGGIPPYETTQQYVKMVLRQYERYRNRG